MNAKMLLLYASAMPKSLYVNLRAFDFRTACKLPLLVGRKVRIKSLHRGDIVLGQPVRRFGIKLGVVAIGGKSRKTHSHISVQKGGKIIFGGPGELYHGFSLVVGKHGTVRLGSRFFANDDFYCVCEKSITIGDDAHIGWNTSYRDHDGHDILEDGVVCNPPADVTIGNHVWICTDASILKGVSIPDDTVIAQGCLVAKSFDEPGTVLGGSPARVIKRNVTWRI